MDTIRVCVAGATGKLGSMVCSLVQARSDMRLVGAIVSASGGHVGKEIAPGVKAVGPEGLEAALRETDVFVDVTNPAVAPGNLAIASAMGVNCVVGTTGIGEGTLNDLSERVSRSGTSAVVSPNFSVGVNVFWKACDVLARSLEGYEVEIIEVHHDKKKDAPSGTAMKAAEIISKATDVDKFVYGRQGVVGARGREIGIHAVRAGDVVGEHTVIFAGNRERIELTHRAHSREAFAEGCITAIGWVVSKKDGRIHTMAEVLGL
ncbi:MAG TPA: 4-hydroxy-tetrahydrodipicolinate reductase [Methanomassiliicoccales archaeon]